MRGPWDDEPLTPADTHTPDDAAPPLDDEHEGLLDDLSGINPGIEQNVDGFRYLATEKFTPDQTQTTLAVLAGSKGCDLVTLLAATIQRLTDPATNPALRSLPIERQKAAQLHGEQAAFALTDPTLRRAVSNAVAAIDLYTDYQPTPDDH